MLLTTNEIRRHMHDDEFEPEERLIITPILDWASQAKDGQAAIDLRLGQSFSSPRRARLDHLDHIQTEESKKTSRYKQDYHVPMGDYFVLHPRQFVLGVSLEWLHLPANIAGLVTARSSWGRDGLVIATATGVHPTYSGILTLELSNLGEIPLRLYPGVRVAQLFLYDVRLEDGPRNVTPSMFSGSTRPRGGDPASEERRIIRKLRERLNR